MAGPSGAGDALKRFELENDIQATDAIYRYDNAEVQKHLAGKPWTKDPRYFKHVRISALALIKIVMHARSGGALEVMGLMVGKIDPDDPRGPTMIVMDVFALPVEGTETRVNAQADAYEYMVEFLSVARESGRLENVLGWYHSHPGYGCWLSGIDVSTQMLNQQYQEPWLAIVIDPHKTAATGQVEIGAFRTYPQGYKPPDSEASDFESVPLNKIEDFGAHQSQYYQLEISYFKSSCDTALLNAIWNKYWIATLSASPLLSNAPYISAQIKDIADKLESAEGSLSHFGRGGGAGGSSYMLGPAGDRGGGSRKDDSQLRKVVRDSSKVTREHLQGAMTQVMKNMLFNPVGAPTTPAAAAMDTS
jgi:COP9 signalosome complex subunit 5